MSINSIGSASSLATQGMRALQKPDPAKMAEELFSKLDTKGQGYLEKTDLETAFSKIGDSGSSSSNAADQMFAKLDGNGDGKVTKEEMSATLQQIASQLDGPFPRMRMQGQGDTPPPPQDGQQVDEGFTKDQLTTMAKDTNSAESKMTDLFSQLADNFSTADANGDGKVTRDEALAFQQANSSNADSQSDATSSSTSSSDASDMQFMRKMMELLHAYGDTNHNSTGTSVSTAA